MNVLVSHRLVPVFVAGLLLVTLAAPDRVAAQGNPDPSGFKFNSGQSIQPIFEGWAHNPDGSYAMYFGYINRNYVETPAVPVGPDNKVEPGDADRGQPTLFNTRIRQGETMRVFAMSNWTELDVWEYIMLENIPVVPLYFAKPRPVVHRNGTLIMVDDERLPLEPNEKPKLKTIRFRTLGCYPLSGAIESNATTIEEIVSEMQVAKVSERQGRLIDSDEAASMEKKKREGYF